MCFDWKNGFDLARIAEALERIAAALEVMSQIDVGTESLERMADMLEIKYSED